MPKAAPVDCITCGTLYPRKNKMEGKLGEAPNKYCYRTKCKYEGIRRGHIKQGNKRAGTAGPSSPAPDAPLPAQMVRDDVPSISAITVDEIHKIYGFRCASCRLSAALPSSHTLPRASVFCRVLRRSLDPTRMTARARRNEVDETGLYPNAEFLVFGTFVEDEEDEGYKGTMWVAADVRGGTPRDPSLGGSTGQSGRSGGE